MKYRTSRRYNQLSSTLALLCFRRCQLQLVHSECLDVAQKFRLSCRIRRMTGTMELIQERLDETIVHGKNDPQ